jgi:RNA polymerase sigma factor for flagellar operon FliA
MHLAIPIAMEHAKRSDVEAIALDLMPAVKNIARGLCRRLPAHASIDDLIGAGNLGLVQALRHYESRDDVPFEAYALRRIRGAMLDYLRAGDPLTRRERRSLVSVRNAAKRLQVELRRAPTQGEVAEACGMTQSAYQRVLDSERSRRTVSLDTSATREDGAAVECRADDPNAEQLVLARHDFERLAAALERLPKRMQKVVELCFSEGRKLREVAAELGISQTRAHQLREEAVERLQKSYRSYSLLPPVEGLSDGAQRLGAVVAARRCA